jgi:hypothetical protein
MDRVQIIFSYARPGHRRSPLWPPPGTHLRVENAYYKKFMVETGVYVLVLLDPCSLAMVSALRLQADGQVNLYIL